MDSNSGFPVVEFAAMDVSGFETAFEAENCGVCSNVFATSWADERPVNDVAVCCNVFKMRTAEERLHLIEKCLGSFGKKMVGIYYGSHTFKGSSAALHYVLRFLTKIKCLDTLSVYLYVLVYVVWKIQNDMNNKLVHTEIPDEPHVPLDRAVQIARRIQGGCIAISLQEAV
ncbi:hypothetical protein ACE6H2_006471 [Prunus campanulata]